MPLFTLPLDAGELRSASRLQQHHHSSRKRRRASSTDSDDDSPPTPDFEPPLSAFAAASTNPLSLTPEEILQYKVAGLSLDQNLPTASVHGWPHQGFQSEVSLGTKQQRDAHPSESVLGANVDENEVQIRDYRDHKPAHLRTQHLSALVAVLHRCLLEGDIRRATRAWALLLRAQVRGRGIDVRSAGYWGIGAELLMRNGEQAPRKQSDTDEAETPNGDGTAEAMEEHKMGETNRPDASIRWGTASGLEKLKGYYERLILQYPYRRQWPNSINSLDFWPAMIGCEIYGIQYEHKQALEKISTQEEDLEEEEGQEEVVYGDDPPQDPDEYAAWSEKKDARRAARIERKLWEQREHVRQQALGAAEKVAVRMDELMKSLPFSDSTVLGRLRAYLALYVGDLSVPSVFECDLGKKEEHEGERDGGSMHKGEDEEDFTEYRLLERQTRAEHERGLALREEHLEKARSAFAKVSRAGGGVGLDIDMLK
jgi:hypothetical protein